MIKLELTAKMLDFVIDAIDFRIKAYEEIMRDDKTTEDEFADMGNDAQLLREVKHDMERQRKY